MQLRMAARRSLNGSMTVVGDIAQATGTARPARLGRRARATSRSPAGPGHRAHRRLPHPGPDHGAGGAGAAGGGAGARSRRRRSARASTLPTIVRADAERPRRGAIAAAVERLAGPVGDGSIAVVVPDSMVAESSRPRSTTAGIALRPGRPRRPRRRRHRRAGRRWSRASSSTASSSSSRRGSSPRRRRACGRCTSRSPAPRKALAVVHAEPLPEALLDGAVLPG